MKIFARIFFLVLAASLILLPIDAEAARLGGGKSFGSRPSMSAPAPRPAPSSAYRPSANRPYASSATSQGKSGGFFSSFGGGMLGGFLAGSLVGSLFSGPSHPQQQYSYNGAVSNQPVYDENGNMVSRPLPVQQKESGFGLLDLILVGLIGFILFRIFRRRRSSEEEAPQRSAASTYYATQTAGAGDDAPYLQRNGRAAAAGAAAAAGWDGLRSGNRSYDEAPDVPEGFDVEGFLRGAKMAYTRLQASWDRRDLNDIASFANDAVMEEIRRQAYSDPNPSKTEILHVSAKLLSVREFGADDSAEVYFEVLLREDPRQREPNTAREVWTFVRRHEVGSWKLDGIQQVEE